MNEKLKGLSIIAWISILAIVLASVGISGVTARSEAGVSGPAPNGSDFVPNEAIVGFHKSVTTQDQNAIIQAYDGRILKRNEALNSVLVSIEDEEKFINEITKEQSVKYAEHNGIVHAMLPPDAETIEPPEASDVMQPTPNDQAKQRGSPQTSPPELEEIGLPEGVEFIQHTPNDPLWSDQWGPQSIKCPEAWDIEQGSLDVCIAIVDTGIDYTHEDLTNYDGCGWDWVNGDGDPWDDNGHGTHCAGIAAATMDNSHGIAGVAQVSVAAEKVLNAYGGGTWYDCALGVIDAIDYCHADVISMSFGGTSYSYELEDACQYAWDEGAVLVGASGNSGGTPVLYPARYDTVICVGSIDEYDVLSYFSQYGPSMELVAPGEAILSTYPGDDYIHLQGTSMSTPHVAGVAALVISQNPSWTNSVVRTDLTDTAVDLGATGWDQYYGYGKVDACAALGGCGGPGKPVLIYPAEDIYFDTTPTYTWVRVIDSTWYYLYISGPSGKIFGKWYSYGICSEQTCSVTPPLTLSGGGYSWWILTWNSGGYGPWSDRMDFSVCPPGKATLKSPSGITTDRNPEYSWDKALGSTWYYLYIYNVTDSVWVYSKWYMAKNVCSGGACSELPPVTLDYDKDYAWWLLTYNPIGYGPWSDRMDFTVKTAETGFNEQFGGSAIPQNWKKAHGAWSVGSGWLHSTCSGGSNWSSIFYDQDYYNFVYETKMYRSAGDGCSNAMVVRGSPYPLCDGDKAWKTAYYFQYSRTGYYGIWKATCGCGWEWIQPWTYSDEINQGDASNILKVWFVGDHIYFFINHVLVWTGTNDQYSHGRVGLSYYQSCCGDFWTDYATLDIVGVAAEPSEEVSKKQRQLNEKAKIQNDELPKEYYPIKEQKKKPKNKERSG